MKEEALGGGQKARRNSPRKVNELIGVQEPWERTAPRLSGGTAEARDGEQCAQHSGHVAGAVGQVALDNHERARWPRPTHGGCTTGLAHRAGR